MCIFVTGTLPEDADLEAVRHVAAPFGARKPWVAIANPNVEAQLPAELRYYHVTGKACDCDVVLGSRARNADGKPTNRSLPRHAKRWSDGKKARWLAQQADNLERLLARPDLDPEPWLHYLVQLTAVVGEAGILLHHYHGSVAGEHITVTTEDRIPVGVVTADALLDLRPDVLYRFGTGRERGRRTRG
jgi:hypothetical protein